MHEDEMLTTREVAAYLRLDPLTIYRWRKRNHGPRWIRDGRFIRYRRSDVLAWEQQQVTQPAPEALPEHN